jgi:hypothetical protein
MDILKHLSYLRRVAADKNDNNTEIVFVAMQR